MSDVLPVKRVKRRNTFKLEISLIDFQEDVLWFLCN